MNYLVISTSTLHRLPCLFLLLITYCLLCAAPAQAVVLSHHPQRSLSGQVYALPDPQEHYTLEQIQQPELQQKFVQLKGMPAFGYQTGAIWLRLHIQRDHTSPEVSWLELNSPFLDEAILYSPNQSGQLIAQVSGDHHSLRDRNILYRSPVFRIQIPENSSQTYYLRIKGNNSLSFGMYLWAPEAFVSAVGLEQLAMGLFLSVHLILIITNIWFYQATRDTSYAWFVLFTSCNLLTSASAEGYSYLYIPWLQTYPTVNESIMIICWMFSLVFGALFLFHYLGLLSSGSHSRWFRRFIAFSVIIAFFSSLLALGSENLSHIIRPFYQIWSLLCSVLVFGITVTRCFIEKNNLYRIKAKIILIGMFPYWVGLFLRFMRNLSLIPPGVWADNSYYMTMIFYLLVMNYALSRHYLALRKEKDQAQAKALALSKQTERILEARVKKRTQELNTALTKVEHALALEKRVQQEQQQFFATVSHELRTPLAVIDITAENLSRTAAFNDPVTQDRYKKILRATARLSSLLENCLREDRFLLLHSNVNYQPCSLHDLLHDAAEACQTIADKHQIIVDSRALPQTFICDKELTRLALRTLADNAIKYTPADSTIILRGHKTHHGVEIQVIDNGYGITESEREQIFQRYYRGSRSKQQAGTGLGLPQARDMIERQGGTVTLDTQWHTQGACFTVYLPDRRLTQHSPVKNGYAIPTAGKY
ncbi:sensor histidine kinase [Plesiomonas sp.]|uniref:sensor histidine kinase n=1 Tax=Plesiomonas sp. TaxID=2486279 RepID=UPI003F3ABBFE